MRLGWLPLLLVPVSAFGQVPSASQLVELCGGYRADVQIHPRPGDMIVSDAQAAHVADILQDRMDQTAGLLALLPVEQVLVTDEAQVSIFRVAQNALGDDRENVLAVTPPLEIYQVLREQFDATPVDDALSLPAPDAETYLVLEQTPLIADLVITEAVADFNGSMGQALAITIAPTLEARMLEITSNAIGQRLALVYDDTVLTAPIVQSPIGAGSLAITGAFSFDELEIMAARLNAGTMLHELEIIRETVVPAADSENELCAGLSGQGE